MITITETGDHHQPEWLITFTGIRTVPLKALQQRLWVSHLEPRQSIPDLKT
jgi:hypothetical protein